MQSPMIITVKLTPKASKNAVQGWAEDADGQKILKCSVTTVPEKGKANKALIELLAKHYKVAKSNINIVRGDTDRLKTIEIQGDIDLSP
jgi:uncharacterized protein (TIGR00251 family)